MKKGEERRGKLKEERIGVSKIMFCVFEDEIEKIIRESVRTLKTLIIIAVNVCARMGYIKPL